MKKGLIVVIFISAVGAQTAVKDFAPLKIGNVWEYAYVDTTYILQLGATIIGSYIEQSNARIEVKEINISGSDTFYIIYCTRTGTVKKTYYTDTTDSIIAVADNDSIAVNSSGILPSAGFKCPIFPVYSKHTFDTSSNLSWDRIMINEDTLIRILPTDQRGSTYVQDIGAIKYYNTIIVNSFKMYHSAILVKFNGKTIDANKLKRGFDAANPAHTFNRHNSLSIYWRKIQPQQTNYVFLLNGVRILADKSIGTQPAIHRKITANP
jgi:hypothetical protein